MKAIQGMVLGVLVVLSCSMAVAQSGITSVWAVDDGEKVKQTDLNHWAKTSANNPVWDGGQVTLFSGRNETVAFQLILEAAGGGASAVNVRLDSLQQTGGTYVITNAPGATDPTSFVGRRIELFVEHYTNVTQRSPFIVGNGMYDARPLPDAEHLGWIPDALVPFEAPVKSPAHGQGGAPFPIGSGKTQGVWIDIYVPKAAPAGLYTGTIRVLEGSTVRALIPVTLQVYGFTLPDETHQKTFYSWNQDLVCNRYGVKVGTPAYWTLFHKFMNMAHRHRIDLVDGHQNLDGFNTNLAGYYTGTYYQGSYGYEGPGEGIGNRVYSIGSYDQPNNGWVSGFTPATAQAWQAAADSWEQWFLDHAPATLRFKYMDDEGDVTNPSVVQLIKDKCSWIKSSPGVGKNLHRFFTKEWVYRGFEDYIDFWGLSSSPGIKMQDLRDLKPKGNLFCSYNGTRPLWGNMEVIDGFATDNRVNPWIAWKYGIDMIFLWTTSFYAEDLPPHPNAKNVWDDNYLPSGDPYGSTKSWGAGMVFYPGNDIQYSADNRGVDGPIGCIRMKNFRRGVQDYEYLWLAKQAGIDVTTLVNQVVPHALDDYGDTYLASLSSNQQPTYPQRGYPYEAVRKALAQRIASNGAPLPSGTLTVTPLTLPAAGGEVTLTWTAQNATGASIDNGVGEVGTTGSTTVRINATTCFTLCATNNAGSTELKATVKVTSGTEQSNVVTNYSFETGTDAWSAYCNGAATFESTSGGVEGSRAAHFSISTTGSNVQIYQAGLPLEANSVYRLTFSAYSSTGHGMDVSVQQHGAPYVNYGLAARSVSLGTAWNTYTIEFTTKNFTGSVNDARLMFWLTPYAASGDQYWIDAVELRKLGVTSEAPAPPANVPAATALLQNFPNPFNPSTTLKYTLASAQQVTLKVYDAIGREVALLVDGETQGAGSHAVVFDASRLASGMYLYRLSTPSQTFTNRMLLVR